MLFLSYALVNRANEQFLGLRREAMIGHTVHELFDKSYADFADARENQLLTSNDIISDEHELDTPGNGKRVVVLRRLLLRDALGNPQFIIGVNEDITERKRSADLVTHLARHDALTGLANRAVFVEKIEEASARLRRQGEAFFVMMLDLDRFKSVNDTLGHPAGDQLLKDVAKRLRALLRETDLLARLGGDEFAIVLPAGDGGGSAVTTVANRIIHAIGEPFDLEDSQVNVGVSIGIAAAPAHGDDPTDLVKKADIALYRSKSGGRNRHCFFDAEMLDDLEARNQLEQDLRAAIVDGKLELHYQPYVDAKTGAICGVEALARWSHPERGMIPPDQFIPLAERSGLIVPLGN